MVHTVPVSDDHHLIHLYHFLVEEVYILQVCVPADVRHSIQEHRVVGFREVDAGKQVRNDAKKQRNVMRQKLWHIHVHYRPQHLHNNTADNCFLVMHHTQ